MKNWIDRITDGATGFLAKAEDEILGIIEPTNSGNRAHAPSTVDVLTIDVSYSMDDPDYPPSRLAGAIQAASVFLKKLDESNSTATVGIVKFSGSAQVVCPAMSLRDNHGELERKLERLETDSSTNIGAGLQKAHRELASVVGKGQQRIILLTDGHSNEGPDPGVVASRVKNDRIQLDIIGIGGSPDEVDEPTLKRMASVVRGERRYWFIRSVGELVQRFEALALREVE